MANCLECGDKIAGRSDKKFCSDACRNAYNNRLHRDKTNLMRNVNNQLRRNFRILKEANTAGKTKIQKEKLLSKGFDFHYLTEIITYRNGSEYRFVYDQGYKILDEDWVLLVQRQP